MENEENEKDYKIVCGIFDIITKKVRETITSAKEEGKKLGVGVYTTRYCDEELLSHPLKPDEDRMDIAGSFDGVDFVFPMDRDESLKENAQKAYEEYLTKKENEDNKEKFKAGFIIGSFDVFHAGHLENISLASAECDNLYVVLKTDERIRANKKKTPKQNTSERAANLRRIKDVKNVLYMDIDSTREDVLNSVIAQFKKDYPNEELKMEDIVAVFGEDLKDKEVGREAWNPINLLFTERPPEKMKSVSSSAYQKQIDEHGGIEYYQEHEDRNIQIMLERIAEEAHRKDKQVIVEQNNDRKDFNGETQSDNETHQPEGFGIGD